MENEVKVLDHGFVRLTEHIGGDASVVSAARVSHGESSKGEAADKKLIQYMLTNSHFTPFEHNLFTFHVKLPIFVARQWIRHRIGVSFNEISARYTEMDDTFYVPEKWRGQDTKNRQGSAGAALTPDYVLSSILDDNNKETMKRYRLLLEHGVAREMARMVLPVNLYTEWYFTCNARSLMNFIQLRSEQHAQFEMRQYANSMWPLFAKKMPWTAEAFLSTLNLTKYQALDGIAGPNIGVIDHVHI